MNTKNLTKPNNPFQVVASIFLFLEFQKNVERIILEEDNVIVLHMKDKKTFVAHAIYAVDEEERCKPEKYPELFKSLKKLNQYHTADKLITIFNYHQPFGNIIFPYEKTFPLTALNEQIASRIKEEISDKGYKIAHDQLVYIGFFSDKERPMDYVEEKFEESFLFYNSMSVRPILQRWIQIFKNQKDITKEQLLVSYCEYCVFADSFELMAEQLESAFLDAYLYQQLPKVTHQFIPLEVDYSLVAQIEESRKKMMAQIKNEYGFVKHILNDGFFRHQIKLNQGTVFLLDKIKEEFGY